MGECDDAPGVLPPHFHQMKFMIIITIVVVVSCSGTLERGASSAVLRSAYILAARRYESWRSPGRWVCVHACICVHSGPCRHGYSAPNIPSVSCTSASLRSAAFIR